MIPGTDWWKEPRTGQTDGLATRMGEWPFPPVPYFCLARRSIVRFDRWPLAHLGPLWSAASFSDGPRAVRGVHAGRVRSTNHAKASAPPVLPAARRELLVAAHCGKESVVRTGRLSWAGPFAVTRVGTVLAT